MAWLCGDLQKIADKGQMVQLDDVWERYEMFAKEVSVNIPQSFCTRRSTFKEKLQSQLGDAFIFFQPLNRCVEERKTILIPKKSGTNDLSNHSGRIATRHHPTIQARRQCNFVSGSHRATDTSRYNVNTQSSWLFC